MEFPPFWGDAGLCLASDILWRTGWPVAAMVFWAVLFSLGLVLENQILALSVFGIAIAALIASINTPLQVVLLGRRHARPGRRLGSFVAHLGVAERLAVRIFLVVSFLPTLMALAYMLLHLRGWLGL